jgi:hypothetical protein
MYELSQKECDALSAYGGQAVFAEATLHEIRDDGLRAPRGSTGVYSSVPGCGLMKRLI